MSLRKTSWAALTLLTASFSFACSSTSGEGEIDDGQTPGTGGAGNGLKEPDKYPAGVADPCVNKLNTGFKNDDICLEPPPPEQGLQIHYGPKPDEYDDPAVMERYVLKAGSGDYVQCLMAETDNDVLKYSQEYHTRARSGTHHVIMWMGVIPDAERGTPGQFRGECRLLRGQVFFPGTQAGIGDKGARLDVPVGGVEAPENKGYARRILPHTPISIETHYVNITDEDLLAEVWMNMIYMPDDEVKVLTDPIFLIGGLNANVAYGEREITGVDKVTPPIQADQEEMRIMGFAAHAHAHTSRVTAWINRAGSTEREYVYETYNWEQPLNAQFDSLHQHEPVLGMGAGKDAAHSGVLTMKRGDTFGWECDVENDDVKDMPLMFGDGAYEKEMCNIFGFFAPGTGTGQWLPSGQPYVRKPD